MAQRSKRKITEEEEVLHLLQEIGAHEVTEEERSEPWYREDIKQLERWRKEEVGKPFTVREKQALYGTKPQKKKPSKA